jgi:hypothetical protein
MGKKRAYCPYCDVYLVHNSLRSRRDHSEGWKHIAAFQTYYARFLAQQARSRPVLSTDDADLPMPIARPAPQTTRPAVVAPPPIPAPPTIPRPPPVSIVRPPVIASQAPPVIGPPRITAPPRIAAPPAIRPPAKKDESA